MWHAYITERNAWDFICSQVANIPQTVRDHVAGTERFIGVFWNGDLVGVYGAARPSVLALEGYIWFHASPEVLAHPIPFARNSLEIVDEFFQHFRELVGVADSERSRRWLTWLGAKFVGNAFIFRRPHG